MANPWRGMTLEWQVSSPPPIFNFDRLPTVVGGPYEYGVPGAVHGIFAPAPVPATAVGRRRRTGLGSAAGAKPMTGGARPMKEVLVVANRTLGGAKLLDAVRARAAAGDVRFRLVVPQSKPSAGLVIYDEAVRESAQVRVDLALSLRRRRGHRRDRRSRRPRPVPGDDGRDRRAPPRRDHRLDAPRAQLRAGCAAT